MERKANFTSCSSFYTMNYTLESILNQRGVASVLPSKAVLVFGTVSVTLVLKIWIIIIYGVAWTLSYRNEWRWTKTNGRLVGGLYYTFPGSLQPEASLLRFAGCWPFGRYPSLFVKVLGYVLIGFPCGLNFKMHNNSMYILDSSTWRRAIFGRRYSFAEARAPSADHN